MPALVNSRVGSPNGIREELGNTLWSRSLKKLRKRWRMSALVIFGLGAQALYLVRILSTRPIGLGGYRGRRMAHRRFVKRLQRYQGAPRRNPPALQRLSITMQLFAPCGGLQSSSRM